MVESLCTSGGQEVDMITGADQSKLSRFVQKCAAGGASKGDLLRGIVYTLFCTVGFLVAAAITQYLVLIFMTRTAVGQHLVLAARSPRQRI